ncbi:hypothetical protein [uncultured Methanobrevibacter sp.]|uniref:hypothetical protein n=1 Tax=uncultured Methanobrevibacter sp. TaxID=253161 RepID=UPI0026039CCC|nr:hypothetical protein [uncultured Methanobrevibacter sp.]
MAEKYLRENKNSFTIVKGSKTYAKISSFDDAIFIRDLLVENDWNLDKIPQTIKNGDNYLVLSVLDEKIHLIAKYKAEPSQETVDKLTKKHKRNPNNSKYGLNITKVFETFVIKKQIAGDDYIFGYYDNLEDAEFVRNFLMDNDWNVNGFETVNFCDETGMYKVVKVIDDKAYVLDSFTDDNIDLDRVYGEFLSRISKHKYGLASYPHLDLLKDEIESLEEELGVKAVDDVWSFDNITDDGSALNDIIFTLTPFEKSIYDSIGEKTSLEDVKRSLIRYKSKNFDEKIARNLDRLIEKNLVEKVGNDYKKTNL